jgi:hypothetical protein
VLRRLLRFVFSLRLFAGSKEVVIKLRSIPQPERACLFSLGGFTLAPSLNELRFVHSARAPVRLVSAWRPNLLGHPEAAMEDLDLAEMAQQLLAAVRKLPPGQKRQNALIELGLLRSRMCQLVHSASVRLGELKN